MTEASLSARRLGAGSLCCLSAAGTVLLALPAQARPPQPPAVTLFTARCLNTSLECVLSVLGVMLLAPPAAAQTLSQPVHRDAARCGSAARRPGTGACVQLPGAVRQQHRRASPNEGDGA